MGSSDNNCQSARELALSGCTRHAACGMDFLKDLEEEEGPALATTRTETMTSSQGLCLLQGRRVMTMRHPYRHLLQGRRVMTMRHPYCHLLQGWVQVMMRHLQVMLQGRVRVTMRHLRVMPVGS